jgi:hypothetical protein
MPGRPNQFQFELSSNPVQPSRIGCFCVPTACPQPRVASEASVGNESHLLVTGGIVGQSEGHFGGSEALYLRKVPSVDRSLLLFWSRSGSFPATTQIPHSDEQNTTPEHNIGPDRRIRVRLVACWPRPAPIEANPIPSNECCPSNEKCKATQQNHPSDPDHPAGIHSPAILSCLKCATQLLMALFKHYAREKVPHTRKSFPQSKWSTYPYGPQNHSTGSTIVNRGNEIKIFDDILKQYRIETYGLVDSRFGWRHRNPHRLTQTILFRSSLLGLPQSVSKFLRR